MANQTTLTSINMPKEVVPELFNKVKGHSTIAKLSRQMAVPFSGTDVFTFNLDGEVSIVGEGGQKPAGSAVIAPVTVKPLKVVYQHRVTDEFLKGTQEKQMNILEEFNVGFSRKIASGLDLMAMHGVNPADMKGSSAIGTNHLDAAASSVTLTAGQPVAALTDAVAALGDADNTGFAFSKTFAAELGKYAENKTLVFPEFRLGGHPATFNGITCDVNSTVNKTGNTVAYVGDFENALRWGYAEDITMEVIQFGDPDGLGDLKRTNQVVIRAEAYIGWGILDNGSFAKIVTE